VRHESLVIILSVGGSVDTTSLADLADAVVRWQRVEREGNAACIAARVAHDDAPEQFVHRVREWGQSRGWVVTVARCGRVN